MDHISSLLPTVLRRRGLMGHVTAALMTHRAQQWFAEHVPAVADQLRAASFKDGELIIHAVHSIAAQECQEHAQDLLEYLRASDPLVSVRGVRIVREP